MIVIITILCIECVGVREEPWERRARTAAENRVPRRPDDWWKGELSSKQANMCILCIDVQHLVV